MAIKYAIQQINRKGATPDSKITRYYAQAKYDGVTSQEDIAQMVSQISAISVGDVLSVMNTVSMLLSIELANGRIVELGDLGRFRATLRSKSCEKPEEFKREMIHGNRVIFVPGAQIRQKMTSASYLKYNPTSLSSESGEKPNATPGNGTPGESGSQTPSTGNETGGSTNPNSGQTGM
ncbi:HU family DNA-binding protein [Porphyromonas uenonis]|uniref:HU family DNA-binding protein n=1 Tax=Porphyromonas uenonis TaxID=281920 RepID=UPI00046E54FD|nr:HU family DNA-binding protein [Porphyromonas uenonis]